MSLTARGPATVGDEQRFVRRMSELNTPGVGSYNVSLNKSQLHSNSTFTKQVRLRQKITKSPGPLDYSPQLVQKRSSIAVFPRESRNSAKKGLEHS